MIYGKEEQKKAIAARVEELRTVAGYYPMITKIYNQFDGKVFNCRLEKALHEATQNKIHVENKEKYISIYYYNRGETFTLTYMKKEDMPNGKRIEAEKWIESAREKRADLLKRAADIETAAGNIDTTISQLKELKKHYNTIIGSLPYYIQDVYGLNRIY